MKIIENDTNESLLIRKDINKLDAPKPQFIITSDWYKTVIQSALDGFFLSDLQGNILDVNVAFCRQLGYSREELLAMTPCDFDVEFMQANEKLGQAISRVKESGGSLKVKKQRRKDGRVIDAAVSVRYLDIKPGFFFCFTKDITEQIKAKEELQKSHDYLENLNNSLDEVIFSVAYPDRIIQYVNSSVKRVFGYEVEECIGKNTRFLFSTYKEYQNLRNGVRRASKRGGNSLHSEFYMIRKNGKVFPAEITATFMSKDGRVNQVIGLLRDITERKRAEEQLENSRHELRSLYAYLQSLEEKRIAVTAHEIHDELGQALAALKMDLSWLCKNLPAGQESLVEKTEMMLDLVDSNIKTVRRIVSGLRPAILDDLGLSAAIQWYAREFQNRSEIKVDVSSSPHDIFLDKERSIAIFRILQAALTNVAQHANATHVVVNLNKRKTKLVLRVIDNGTGILQEKITSHNSFGIIGMRERTQMLEGNLEIKGGLGSGTTITVSFPLDEE